MNTFFCAGACAAGMVLCVAAYASPPKKAIKMPAGSAAHVYVLTDRDNGHSLTIHPGDTLKVRLSSNPSTGYSWCLVTNSSMPVQPIGTPRFTAAPQPAGHVIMAGASGMEEFRFKASGASYSEGMYLRLLSLRPFDRGITHAQLWEVNLTIAPSK